MGKLEAIRQKYVLVEPYVTIKIPTKGIDRILYDLLLCLQVQDRDELPFDLSPYTEWPSGERNVSARAKIFMRNGFASFVDYKKDDKTSVTEEPPSKANVGGFPAKAGAARKPRLTI